MGWVYLFSWNFFQVNLVSKNHRYFWRPIFRGEFIVSIIINLFEIILGRFIWKSPGILQEVRRCHQEEEPWLHLCLKTRLRAQGSERRAQGKLNVEKERGRKWPLVPFGSPNLPIGLALPKRLREGEAARRIKVKTRLKIYYYRKSSFKSLILGGPN